MGLLLLLVAPIVVALLVYWVCNAVWFFYSNWTSLVRLLPGPPSPSFVYGNEKEIFEEGTDLLEKWVAEYGPTIHFQSFVGMSKLYTTDLKALNHILKKDYIYQKPEWFRYRIQEVIGEGLVVVEGDTHKNQRRVMNQAFGPSQIRELTDIFIEKSLELRDIWEAEIQSQGGIGNIDALVWMNRVALDIIGLAGFNYRFNALSEGENSGELNRAFHKILENLVKFSPVSFLRAAFPSLRWLPKRGDPIVEGAHNIMESIGRELIATGKRQILGSNNADRKSLKNKDLLTILLRANMATDLPDDQRMTDAEILAQIPTFLSVGHESTSTATVWGLYALIKAPEIQKKLRDELFWVPSDSPSMDELNTLPYLDAVVREILRLYAPLPFTFRVSVEDDVLPLSTPVRDKEGKIHESLHVQKGQMIIVPIVPVNNDSAIWGEDSHEFRPERWMTSIPDTATGIPGVWSNSLAFLGGPRACIGYRFAVMEMKSVLFALIRAFEFEAAGPVEDIGKKFVVVQRPFLKSKPEAGPQMPLKVKVFQKS
ncbi:hypothetical protein MD484_g3882, partial [Candolleomyces efflorescens]